LTGISLDEARSAEPPKTPGIIFFNASSVFPDACLVASAPSDGLKQLRTKDYGRKQYNMLDLAYPAPGIEKS